MSVKIALHKFFTPSPINSHQNKMSMYSMNSKFNSRILAGVDDEFDVPYWGWCP